MIVCVCRNISDSEYATPQQLLQRLEADDQQCASCVRYVKGEIEKAERESRNQTVGKQIFLR